MNLFIPAIGDRLTLTKYWYFDLYLESRNIKFAKSEGHILPLNNKWGVYTHTGNISQWVMVDHGLPAGTILECDQITIKSNSKRAVPPEENHDFVTWKIIVDNKPVAKKTFLGQSDCSSLEFDETSISKYRDRK